MNSTNPNNHETTISSNEYGSVHNVPYLPTDFTKTFDSHYINIGNLSIHAVIGGQGTPLLLHAGWPENWYAWRHLMLPLSKYFTVITVDPRGFGLSGRPDSGFDVDTLANDMLTLMDQLGHSQFFYVGHDIGVMVGYALAAMEPNRVLKLAIGEGMIPGASPSPALISDDRTTSDFLWHFNFNRALEINERLVEGREALYFGYQFESKSGHPDAIDKYARDFYIELLRKKPGTLKASFEYYRSIDTTIPQIRAHMKTKLSMPVFTFAGDLACGPIVEQEWQLLATNVTSVIITNSGHFPAEEQPEQLLKHLLPFFSTTEKP
ncbi:alpha/beta hydrolase [Fulvivirga maritima]|uniref:alpha/beta fold hydrolase n=1 Tax=Fulvivirga maritima TaxID=2904247 RepID=UPI001F15A594|nr:alpha/beta hydrolase [Fulvivirga maritima]UII25449.1 alpha/beta hydrolase [Fulvivirga maritima]